MRIWLFSDTHTEFGVPFAPLSLPEFDVVVIAGDFGRPLTSVLEDLVESFIGARAIDKPIIYVPGNHDFYGANLTEERAQAARHAWPPNLRLLDDRAVTIDGIRFIGSTLWTDYALDGRREAAMLKAAIGLNDHRLIKITHGIFSPRDAMALHEAGRAFIEQELMAAPGRSVVVTHHLPLRQCIHAQYANSDLNPAFASDLSTTIEEFTPELWIHGHTHTSVDLRVGATRVVCNPRGYPNARGLFENRQFNPAMIVELPD